MQDKLLWRFFLGNKLDSLNITSPFNAMLVAYCKITMVMAKDIFKKESQESDVIEMENKMRWELQKPCWPAVDNSTSSADRLLVVSNIKTLFNTRNTIGMTT